MGSGCEEKCRLHLRREAKDCQGNEARDDEGSEESIQLSMNERGKGRFTEQTRMGDFVRVMINVPIFITTYLRCGCVDF